LTDHAIVVLAHLARTAHVCVHPAKEIADATRIPLPTVQKVLKQLSRESLLISTRGARGGYSLARDPAAMSVAQVVEAMEGPLALTTCALTGEGCSDDHDCQVAGHWPVINGAVRTALDAVSILDISRPASPSVRAAPRAGNEHV
jgi:FeS assembly SUF system regulator